MVNVITKEATHPGTHDDMVIQNIKLCGKIETRSQLAYILSG